MEDFQMSKQQRRTHTTEFKKQLVDLYNAGKPRKDILIEYDITGSVFDRWVRQFKNSGSFKESDNLTLVQKELIQLRKRNRQLEMEVDILKQAALIMGRKEK